jgi:hypothetical protein
MFADDTSCLSEGKDLNQLVNFINIELQKISNWFTVNKMALNISKTKYIIFRTPGKKIPANLSPITINSNMIDEVQNPDKIQEITRVFNDAANIDDRFYKLLGVYFDEYLNFDKHIDVLCAKLTRANFCLRRASNLLPLNLLKNLYHALFHPHILYCLNIICCTNKTNLNRVKILQKKAIRIISKVKSNSHTSPLFIKNNVLPLDEQIKFQNLKLMHSIVYDYGPKSFRNTVKNNENRDVGYNLRSGNLMFVPAARIELFKRIPLYYLPLCWNMAGDVIHYSNPCTFQIALKSELFESLKQLNSH